MSTLIRKLKRGRLLLVSNEKAFLELNASASPEQVNAWTTGAQKALEERMDHPDAMDYFSLAVPPGKAAPVFFRAFLANSE